MKSKEAGKKGETGQTSQADEIGETGEKIETINTGEMRKKFLQIKPDGETVKCSFPNYCDVSDKK